FDKNDVPWVKINPNPTGIMLKNQVQFTIPFEDNKINVIFVECFLPKRTRLVNLVKIREKFGTEQVKAVIGKNLMFGVKSEHEIPGKINFIEHVAVKIVLQ